MRKFVIVLLVSVIAMVSTLATNITKLDNYLYSSGQYTYRLNASGEAIIVDFIADENQDSLTLPSFLDDYPVVSVDEKAINCAGFTEVILSESISYLSKNAFYNCLELVYLSVASQLNSYECFEGMENLKSLNIAYGTNGVMVDYDSAQHTPWYESIHSIESISIDSGIKYLGNNAFRDMDSLTEVSFSDSVAAIGEYCFYNDINIKDLRLPYQLTTISSSAFNNDGKLENCDVTITVPQNVSFLGEDCFSNEYSYLVYSNSKVSDYMNANGIEYQLININFSQDTYDIELGDSEVLNVIDPSVYAEELVYTSTNQEVFTIDANGKIQTVSTGTAQVVASTATGYSSAVVNIYVDGSDHQHKFQVLACEESFMINPYGFDDFLDKSNTEFTYISNNENVATVDQNGNVTAHKQGSATIEITSNTGKKAYYLINSVLYVYSINVSQDTVNMRKGGYYYISASVYPKNADNSQLVYSSSDESVATVTSSGRVYALKNGSCIITISSTDGSNVEKKVAINVSSATVYVENAPVILMPGSTYRLRCSTNDASKVYYLSTDENIAVVDASGAVTALSVGECNIVIYNEKKTAYRTIKCIVYDAFSYGIDISEWNGRYYTVDNFKKVKADGIDFVYIRCSCGYGYKDPIFERNYAAAKAAGLDVGPYHYLEGATVEEAAAEARWTLYVIEGKQYEYPVMLDIEDKAQKGLTQYEWNQIVQTYCDIIEAAGYKVIVYSYASMLSKNYTKYENYVANWYVNSPDFHKSYTIWQFMDYGKVNGLSSYTDMDICFFDYPTYMKENHLNGY